ncbi:MAG: hypothetical protein K2P37_06010, partial [Oscillospiraceae bacterium]|nr:hypothetical protein [Oscillospiraceae bacterium]
FKRVFGYFCRGAKVTAGSGAAEAPGQRIETGSGAAPQGPHEKSPCENFLFPLDIPKEISYDSQTCKAQALYTEEGAP